MKHAVVLLVLVSLGGCVDAAFTMGSQMAGGAAGMSTTSKQPGDKPYHVNCTSDRLLSPNFKTYLWMNPAMAAEANRTGVLPGYDNWSCSTILDETKDNRG